MSQALVVACFRLPNLHNMVIALLCNSKVPHYFLVQKPYRYFQPQVDHDPKTEVFTHDRPLEEDLIDAASIFALNHHDSIKAACRQIIKDGVMPAIRKVFVPQPWKYPIQFHLWLEAIQFFLRHKLLELQYIKENTYLTVTTTDSHIQFTFYPVGAYAPTLHL
jgi:hypothetical protein